MKPLSTAVAVALLLAACSGRASGPTPPPPSGSVPPGSATPGAAASPMPMGQALAANERLCPDDEPPKVRGASGEAPAELRAVLDDVEKARGLEFSGEVDMWAVSRGEMASLVLEQVSTPGYEDYMGRRGAALAAMGAIPEGTDLGSAYRDFVTGQVIGFYEPHSDVLVFIGSDELGSLDRFTLIHELLHAVEDQSFDLTRVLEPEARCRDDAGLAARAVAEGSATSYSLNALRTAFSQDELGGLLGEALDMDTGIPESVPEFVSALELWPYTAGMAFVDELRSDGGNEAVGRAFEELPTTSEQVIHPEKYPSDAPTDVDVADALGPPGWETVDVGEAGEIWLKTYLDVRGVDDADEAAAGWDGGIYRAWTSPDASRTAVVLETAWDSEADALAFETAVAQAIVGLDATVTRAGDRVTVRFGTDPEALAALPAN